jgi:hypothetical protein
MIGVFFDFFGQSILVFIALKYFMDISLLLKELENLEKKAKEIEEQIRILNTDSLLKLFEIFVFIFNNLMD